MALCSLKSSGYLLEEKWYVRFEYVVSLLNSLLSR